MENEKTLIKDNGSRLASNDLLCCPFCGGDAKISKHFREEMWRLIHRCKTVGAITIDWSKNLDRLISTWNTRAI